MQYIESKSAVKLGVFIFFAALVIAILILWKSNLLLMANGYMLIGEFNTISGLTEGSEVRYRGYKIGRVLKILPSAKNVRAYFWIDPDVKIPTGSKMKIAFDGLIGEKYLAVIPNMKSKTYFTEDAVLEGYSGPGLSDFIEVGTENLQETKAILESFRKIFTNKEVMDSIQESIIEIKTITDGVNLLVANLNKLADDKRINNIINNIDIITAELKKSTEEITKNGRFSNDVNQILSNTKSLTKNLNSVSIEIKSLFDDPKFKEGLKNTVQQSQAVVEKGGSFLDTIGKIRFNYDLGLNYNIVHRRANYLANTTFTLDDKYLLIGLSDQLDVNHILNLQIGKTWHETLATRLGFLYSSPGLGVDYLLSNDFDCTLELYNFDQTHLDAYLRYHLSNDFKLVGGAKHNLANGEYDYSLGVSFHSNNK